MILKSKCNRCLRKVAVEGEHVSGSVVCPNCSGSIQLPRVVLEQGDVLGNFRVNRHIGSGAMGDVYLATQINMERDVAIKIIPPSISEDPEAVESFLSEVRTLAKLDHPNIVTAFEAGEAEGHHFLAMTYLDGGSMEDKVQREGPLSEAEALRMTLCVAKALQYAWDHFQIIHRDVKPENVMLDSRTPEPKVLDLGISRVIGPDHQMSTEKGMLIGTPYYMSPEQADPEQSLDCRSDMYSLGCTLFHLLTGRVPYDAPEPMAVLVSHRADPIPDPTQFVDGLQPTTVDLIHDMMAKDKNERFASWDDTIRAIRVCLKNATIATRQMAPVTTVTSRLPRPKPSTETDMEQILDDELMESDAAPPPEQAMDDFPEPPSKLVPILSLILIGLIAVIATYVILASRRIHSDDDTSDTRKRRRTKTERKTEGDVVDKVVDPADSELMQRYKALMEAEATDLRGARILYDTMTTFLPELKGKPEHGIMEARLKRFKEEWVEQLMRKLSRDARRLARRSPQGALDLYRNYDGPFKEESKDARLRAYERLKNGHPKKRRLR